MDPKFLLLPHLEQHGARYSPLEQILAAAANAPGAAPHAHHGLMALRRCARLDLGKICDVNDQLGDDMILYRMNEAKALEWLKQASRASVGRRVGVRKRREGKEVGLTAAQCHTPHISRRCSARSAHWWPSRWLGAGRSTRWARALPRVSTPTSSTPPPPPHRPRRPRPRRQHPPPPPRRCRVREKAGMGGTAARCVSTITAWISRHAHTHPHDPDTTHAEATREQVRAAVEIVCDYLTEAWAKKLMEACGLTEVSGRCCGSVISLYEGALT